MLKPILSSALLFAASALAAQAEDSFLVKEGLWDFSINTFALIEQSSERSDMIDPPQAWTECLTTEQDRRLGAQDFAAPGCTIENTRSTANSLSLDMRCVDEGLVQTGTTNAYLSEERDSLHSFMELNAQQNGVTVAVQGLMVFKRIGACEAN